MPASEGKCSGSSSTKACVEPESNQTSKMSSTFFQSSLAARREIAPRAGLVPGVGALLLKGVRDARVDCLVLQDFAEPSPFSARKPRSARPRRAGARSPSPDGSDHAGDAVLAGGRHPTRLPGFRGSAMLRSVCRAWPFDRLVHRDEPLRRVAEDHRLFGPPRVRILMLSCPRAMMLPASVRALMTASLASPFSPLSLRTRLPSKPGACVVNAPFSSTM